MDSKKKIAVVGSGIAGLTAAHLLSADHEVTLFEKTPSLGMDSHSLDVTVTDKLTGERVVKRMDMPLRVFTETYYPHLTSLYETVGVQYSPEDYSGSFTSLTGDSYFGYRNAVIGRLSIPYMLSPSWQLFNKRTWIILRDLIYFLTVAPRHLKNGRLGPSINNEEVEASVTNGNKNANVYLGSKNCKEITLGQYLNEERYSCEFIQNMLYPTMAGILTCSHAAVEQYPAWIVVHYLATRSMRGVRRVVAGTKEVVTALTKTCNVRCGAGVTSITTITNKDGTKQVEVVDEKGYKSIYDHVVIAAQANQAVRMLTNQQPALINALKGFKYEKSKLVLHTDESLMPQNRRDWKSVNFILPADSRKRQDIADEGMATIWLNRAQTTLGLNCSNVFQTWNPLILPSAEHTIQLSEFERPVVTYDSLKCVTDLWKAQGEDNVWVCGSYAHCGMPLLETAVSSAVRVAERLGTKCPWNEKISNYSWKKQQSNGFSIKFILVIVVAIVVYWMVNGTTANRHNLSVVS